MKIQGLHPSTVINVKGLMDILTKLNIGDKVGVEVIDLNGNEITLKFPNGTNVVATTLVPLNVSLGDFLELSVKNKSESVIAFEIPKNINEEAKTNDVINNLLSLKLPPDERNINIGRELVNHNLVFNKDNFRNVINLLSQFEGMDINKAVFIIANGLDKLKSGIETLNKIIDGKSEIGKMINDLAKLLSSKPNIEIVNDILYQYRNVAVKNKIEKENDKISELVNNFRNSNTEIEKLSQSIVKQILNFSSNAQDTVKWVSGRHITADQINHLLYTINNPQIIDFIKDNPIVRQKVLDLLNNKHNFKEFVLKYSDEFSILFKKHSDADQGTILSRVREFLNITRTVNSKLKIEVNELYNDLLQKIDIIEQQSIKGNMISNDNILSTTTEIKNNINIMNNVDNLYNYFQFPVVINEKQVNTELYFIKNSKKNKKIDINNTTFFISLNTDNLGLVEILSSINNKKVTFNFRLKDNKTINYFLKREDILYELIKDKGYDIDRIKYTINTKATDIVNFADMINELGLTDNKVLDVRI